ncbi:long-chain fatty acid transport protein 1 isoform X1 [Tupaia chinensis]|uniref:long-chain fatty acid transport protein 1 isoform X1 n=1 Tax=Tupaia chinensis TaxID=246437 RepID=UPI000FFBF585|nr:long-chain fatty acid transport protein 1 isoform X1 [Tupaia chinensis]
MAAAVAEVSAQLGKSLLKFCSGDLGPEGVLPDTHLLDPLLQEASTAPLAEAPGKGMDDSSISTHRGPRGCPRLPLWCTAGKVPRGRHPKF